MLERLLAQSSRTFALTIPLLPEPVRRRTMLAYLLFRVADTFEDETGWPLHDRLAALRSLRSVLNDGSLDHQAISAIEHAISGAVLSHEGYADLLENFRPVLGAWLELDDEPKRLIGRHLCRTIDGMAEYLDRENGPTCVGELREYCYYVAGIVGELCTDLFVLHSPSLRDARSDLLELAPSFGEGLQMVNILRDESDDESDGRRYIPAGQERGELMELAGGALRRAADYVGLLERHGAAPGIVAFNSLNLLLAFNTLALVRERGPGAKLTRPQVRQMHESIVTTTKAGRSVTPLLSRADAALADAP